MLSVLLILLSEYDKNYTRTLRGIMVKIRERTYIQSDGSIDTQAWLHEMALQRPSAHINLISQACGLAEFAKGQQPTPYGPTCLQQGLKMAEILADLNMDQSTIAAAILYNSVEYGGLTTEDIAEQFGNEVAKLISGALRMEAVRSLVHYQAQPEQYRVNIDNLRKMLLAMVEDVRVVLIKLAERMTILHIAKNLDDNVRQLIAQETFDIYAPLANRLGIGQLKWELEDLCFRFLNPDAYKELAQLLATKRLDREHYIEHVIETLRAALKDAGLSEMEITGRAKHIYSIYRKMQRKDVDYSKIYDVSAVRVLVTNIEDCYTVLSHVHSLWPQIPAEFDDYIANPKPNGYRSLHTAVIGPEGRNLEVQIRTFTMHQESELGVAAHWKYKEGVVTQGGYEEKIAWLRQVLEWQRELTHKGEAASNTQTQQIFDDHVYIFTPAGQIVDLPTGATPLDFAYHIHSDIGHHCRGAKVNGKLVTLTYKLRTGERVEILTSRQASPSRDWLNSNYGYLNTSRARAKVHHWFKQQDYDKHLLHGQSLLENELRRQNLPLQIPYEKIARKFHLATAKDLFVALGNGEIKSSQVIHLLPNFIELPKAKPASVEEYPATIAKSVPPSSHDIQLPGISDVLTYYARCCKPLPGDDIIGYITKGRGIAIHRKDCVNIQHTTQTERLIAIDWSSMTKNKYPVDLTILTHERQGLIKDILSVLANEKVPLLSVNAQAHRDQSTAHVALSIEVTNITLLEQLLLKLRHIPDVISIQRHEPKRQDQKKKEG
jgi:GTP pyrophosphokinase